MGGRFRACQSGRLGLKTSCDSSYLLVTARFWTRGHHSDGSHGLGMRAIVLRLSQHIASSHR
ncbi:hypothetical protein LINPERHAP2_LOCUS3839, partial [Linum perenne]